MNSMSDKYMSSEKFLDFAVTFRGFYVKNEISPNTSSTVNSFKIVFF